MLYHVLRTRAVRVDEHGVLRLLQRGVGARAVERVAALQLGAVLVRALRSTLLLRASTRALVLMLPALQARAVIKGRDFVSPEDVEALAPYVFKHRLECAPGVEDVDALIADATAVEIEKLARASLRRG